MSTHFNPFEPDQPTGDDPLFRDYLLALLDVGATVAQSIKHQAKRQSEPTEEPQLPTDLADQFERVSRAMRRTILLARQIAQPGATAAHRRTQARKRIIRAVEDAIQSEGENPESLRAEFRDRLDGPDLDEEIANRPIQDIIVDIRRDLGLEHIAGTHPWTRRSPRDIETLRALAAVSRSPGPYNPAPHGPDFENPTQPKRRAHPPDDEQHFIALAKRLIGT